VGGNSHFTVAMHILTLLGHHAPKALTSEFIAASVNTNPVFIRRLLGALRTAHLVTSQTGPGGGWTLLRPAKDITLRDVYRAMEERPLFAPHANTPNADCEVGGNIQAVLGKHFAASTRALEQQLNKTSIHDLVREVRSIVTKAVP
jgi:Rrf2 family protein